MNPVRVLQQFLPSAGWPRCYGGGRYARIFLTLARNKVSRGIQRNGADWRDKGKSCLAPEAKGWLAIEELERCLGRILMEIMWYVTRSLASHCKDRMCVRHSTEQALWVEGILSELGYIDLHWGLQVQPYYCGCCVFFNMYSRVFFSK